MHVASLLKADMFEIAIEGAASQLAGLFPGWHEHDRFGILIDEPFGGLGATHLIQLAMMAFYDVKPQRRAEKAVYPEVYAFHVGRGHGAHAPFDFWPSRKEVILETSDPRDVLDAINDRGITRLAVPDRPPRLVEHRPKEIDAALDRIASAFLYDATGRVDVCDVLIRGLNRRTEHNPQSVLKRPDFGNAQIQPTVSGRPVKEADVSYQSWLALREADVTEDDRRRARDRRERLAVAGLVEEQYRRVDAMDALNRMASAAGLV